MSSFSPALDHTRAGTRVLYFSSQPSHSLKICISATSLEVQWLRYCAPNAGSGNCILNAKTKTQYGKVNIKNKETILFVFQLIHHTHTHKSPNLFYKTLIVISISPDLRAIAAVTAVLWGGWAPGHCRRLTRGLGSAWSPQAVLQPRGHQTETGRSRGSAWASSSLPPTAHSLPSHPGLRPTPSGSVRRAHSASPQEAGRGAEHPACSCRPPF